MKSTHLNAYLAPVLEVEIFAAPHGFQEISNFSEDPFTQDVPTGDSMDPTDSSTWC